MDLYAQSIIFGLQSYSHGLRLYLGRLWPTTWPVGDLIQETLELLEINGGEDAFRAACAQC